MAFAISRPRHCGLTSIALLLLLTVVVVSGSTQSTLPVLKSVTCHAFLYASLSDDGAKTSTNNTAINSGIRRDSAASNGVEAVPLSTPTTEDRNVRRQL
ncbi:hypothetical protein PHYBOEH_002358 [Phytophthora boehmeriae]|uniref:Secreted protein n=1 Tax=Phytophthora boehmeriae TaxID=109152 RepID=A0A8T1X764_9STRA|nr:hypothetical protein PHYBOEH_002358 [Phytophthora boehmeriae]